ncbi:hypothetical protein LTR95_011468 [Oleoguttula sp. CCFEE 5521]
MSTVTLVEPTAHCDGIVVTVAARGIGPLAGHGYRGTSVGINTWYTNTANITVATAITQWIQYDDTVVVGNVSTVYDPTATAIYGVYAQGGSDHAYTTVALYPTVALSYGFVPTTSGTSTFSIYEPTATYSTTYTNWPLYTTVSIPSAIPTTLLNQSMAYYQEQWIGTETAATFGSLTIQSPTPYFVYPFIGVVTSASCNHLTTATSYFDFVTVTISGTPTLKYTTIPTATFSTGAPGFVNAFRYDVTIKGQVVQPFPTGVYTDWNYTAFIKENGVDTEGGGENVFLMPKDLPSYLAGIPSVVSAYPNIGSCTNGVGQGEPTVHVPVNALTTESHTTQTVSGNYNKAATTASNPVATTGPDAGLSSVAQGSAPAVDSTTAAADQQGSDTKAGSSPTTSPNAGQQGTTAAGGGSAGQSPSTNAGQPGNPSSAGGNNNPPANAPTTAAQPTAANPASQGEPKGATTSAVAFTCIPPDTTSPAAVTFGANVATQNSASNFVIGSTTIAAGGPAATIGGTTVSVASGGSAVVVNGQTSAIVAPSSTLALVVGGTTLVAGGAAMTVGGTTVALASGGSAIVVNGQTSPLPAATGAPLLVGTTPVATPDASGGYILPGGQTVSAGGLAVESGKIYAVGPSGGLVVNGQTATALPGGGQSGGGVAGAIMSMFGMGGSGQSSTTAGSSAASGPSTPTGTAPAPYTGGAALLNTMTKATAMSIAALLVLVCCL